jgi:hypothetical protein
MQADFEIAAPAFTARPHLVDDSGAVIGWFIEPAGVLVQVAHPTRGTTRMAEWLVGAGFDRLLQRFAGQGGGLRVILDMRDLTGRSATARALMIANAPRALRYVNHVVMLPSRHMRGDYLQIIELTARTVSAMGLRVDIEHDLQEVLTRYAIGLAAPRQAETAAAAR